MSDHLRFILTPLIKIVKDAIVSCSSIGNGIETYPLCEYVMQSTFLKLTGASEQKLKCVLWELATNDYEFRYNYLKDNYGECSNYESKEKVLQNLIKCINKINTNFAITENFKKEIIEKTKSSSQLIFENSIMSKWLSKDYKNFIEIINKINYKHIITNDRSCKLFINKSNLSEIDKKNNLKDAFECMYSHRNRCAHNLLSYQENFPSLSKLISEDNIYENWFLRFFILFLLDEIYINLYMEYINSRENCII